MAELTTGVDDLLKYLREHGETEMQRLAASFGVGVPVIEQWVGALEAAKVVKVNIRRNGRFVSVA